MTYSSLSKQPERKTAMITALRRNMMEKKNFMAYGYRDGCFSTAVLGESAQKIAPELCFVNCRLDRANRYLNRLMGFGKKRPRLR